ncbi:MAG: SapC family protein [Gemmobacter sp.]|jgi:hypothetical protein|nr:SapC family protein [Gemmobacter sp.]
MTQTDGPTPQPNGAGPAPSLPMFYGNPLLLQSEPHREAGLLPANGFGFAGKAVSLPLCAGEFAVAQRHYPIAFVEDDTAAMPMVITGLERDRNLFVGADGSWRAGAYVPAYARRYPFIVLESPDKAQHMLVVDQASDRFVAQAGPSSGADRFFDGSGQATPMAQSAIGFCEAYFADHAATVAFGQALKAARILVPNQANITFPDGTPHTVNGFLSVDEAAFRALPSATVADWHGRGWLDLVILHLASRLSWQVLLDLRAERVAGVATRS